MRRRTIGEAIFWGAAVLALSLYWLTAPNGLPWNPLSPNRYWRYLVAMAGGSETVLSSLAASLAAGLLGAVANRCFGWRVGVAAALVWSFFPGVWNGAVTGGRGVVLASAIVVAAWFANAVALLATRKARETRKMERIGRDSSGSVGSHEMEKRRGKVNRIAGRAFLGAAALFAVASASMHDFRLGEAASEYARLIVREAGDRVILLNGLCDEQIRAEAKGEGVRLIGMRNADDASRSNLVAWVKREWPGETNLWLAAEIGPVPFADAAVKAHPDRFYTMMGRSTTLEKWEARWEAMKPFLKSRDRFIPAMRRQFAYEGNAIGNRIAYDKDAWNVYYRVFTEIHPNNPAACVNLNAMLRRGYVVDESTRRRVESAQDDYAKLLRDRTKARQVAERIVRFGPVMRDEKAYGEMRERLRKRLAELAENGEKPVMIPDLKTLQEWNREMMAAFEGREFDKAGCIARAILSRPAWRGFIPAHAIIGATLMMRGEWVAAEAFMRVAAEAKGDAAPTCMVLNDYAETLRRLRRYDEAEKYARRSVGKTDAKSGWICRLTLAQVLRDRARSDDAEEVRSLVREVMRHAPKKVRESVAREFPR